MEAKQAKSGSAAALKGIELADKQIAMLKDRLLPYDPHIITVPTKYPYPGGFDYEYQGTPFEDYEVKQLQYVTLVAEPDRETAKLWPAAEWQDVIKVGSPSSIAARSNTTTPNPAKESRMPSKKISIADYKNMKKTGAKSSPNPAGGPSRPTHSRNPSGISGGEPLSRDPSFEGAPEVRRNGAPTSVNSVNTGRGGSKVVEKPVTQPSVPSIAKAHVSATTNGHNANTSDHARSKEPTSHPQNNPQSQHPPEHVKHSLPPRPQSPPRKSEPKYNLPDPKQQKRPLESADATQPEKRSKIEHSRTPSNSQNRLSRKPDTTPDRSPSPLKSQGASHTQAHSSPQAKKAPVTKPPNKENPKPEKPLNLPPLLSPLPADLDSSPAYEFSSKKAERSKSSQNTPSKYGLGTDTIIVKKAGASPLAEVTKTTRVARAASEPFELPRLLSPTLPDIVEQELLRLQQKSVALSNEARLNTVEARHEKARRPDAPGVARKTIVPKVGHPPKKPHAESSKTSLVVKLRYKKRRANDIQRILGIRAKPSQDFLRLEKERIAGQKRPQQDEQSEEEDPMEQRSVSKPVAPTASKKRPNDISEPRSEPAAKRAKGPETVDVAKSKTALEPAFKSPALSGPSTLSGPIQKNLLSTPKKGDAMKSVTMRKVNSSDGHAHTPQTSTPASAEKPRVNGINHNDANKELGTFLKRKMDSILHLKDGLRDTVNETQRKLGHSVALECIAVYMVAFAMSDRANKRRSTKEWESVVQLWEFVNGLVKHVAPLQVLSFELGALCREELGRAYNERLTEKFDPETAKVLLSNSAKKDRAWYSAHHPTGPSAALTVKDLGIETSIGPWTQPHEAKEYAFDILERFAKKEKTGWKPTDKLPEKKDNTDQREKLVSAPRPERTEVVE